MTSFTLSTFICIAVLSCISCAETQYCQGSCPEGWVSNNMRCFKYFLEETTWINAEKRCVSLGGNLASEHSERDHQFLMGLQKLNDHRNIPFWIGLSDLHEERIWLWSDGRAVRFTKWDYGQPDNYDAKEHCVHSNNAGTSKWNDIPCTLEYPSICAKRLLY